MSGRISFLLTVLAFALALGVARGDSASDKALQYARGISTRSTLTDTNGILAVSIEATTGQFTIKTGSSHPKPGQNVFYPIGTSYITLRDVGAALMLHNNVYAPGSAGMTGYAVAPLINASMTTVSLAPRHGFRTTYVVTNWKVVQEVEINGTTLLDTNVRHTVSVTNTSAASRQYGVRMMWDWMIATNDASQFRTRQPDSVFTGSFTTYAAPAFKLYEEVDYPSSPTFSIFGSVQGLPLTPQPTLPEQVRYSPWGISRDAAWDFTNTGSGLDSSVCYYWGMNAPLTLAAGATASFTQYVTTQMEAIAPSISVTKTAATTINSGANLTYTFAVKNSGTATATGVVLSDTIPTGTTYVSATGGTSPAVANGIFTMTLGDIAVGVTKTATLVVKVTATTGSIVNGTYSVKASNTGTAYGGAVTTRILTGTAPVVTISPAGPLYARAGQALTFLVTGSDTDAGARITLTSSTLPSGATMTPLLPVTGATGINSRFNWTPCGPPTADYTLTFTATDETGLKGTGTLRILRDVTAPAITITAPALNAAVASLAAVSGTVSDAATGVGAPTFILRQAASGFYWSGTAWAAAPTPLATALSGSTWTRTATLPATTSLTDGLYLIAALAKDGAGNAAAAVSSFTVDKTVPGHIEFEAPLNGSTVNSLLLASGWARDNEGGSGISAVQFSIQRVADSKYWSGNATTGWVTTATILPATLWPTGGAQEVTWTVPPRSWTMPTGANLPNGSYSLIATARDRANNGLTTRITVTVNSAVVVPYGIARSVSGISQVSAQASTGVVRITCTAPINAAALSPTLFAVGVNGDVLVPESATLADAQTLCLQLPAGSLKRGDVLRVGIDGLVLNNGAVFYGVLAPLAVE